MALHPEYNAKTPATQVAKAFSSEITNRHTSQSSALLILAFCTLSNLEAVVSEVRTMDPAAKIETISLDLFSQQSASRAADEIKALVLRINITNNAAMIQPKRCTSPRGIKEQFAANHLGGFLLTNIFAEKFLAEWIARIANLASEPHRSSPIRWSDLSLRKSDSRLPESEGGPDPLQFTSAEMKQVVNGYNWFRVYAQSKTANILTMVALT
ncbi:hypothetical protein B0O99DRAFT_592855 [Bisporella sp. PMI_857]|nr:hypothetical protein B0O99DRAFT_592855 [Bisporella sp. PMI_857]